MSWTKIQIALAHIAKQQLHWQDPQYRLVLQNVAGIRPYLGKVSATNPSGDNAGFERFMAFCESQGFIDSKNGQGYWSNEAKKQCSRIMRKIVMIHEEAMRHELLGPDAVAGLTERMTANRKVAGTFHVPSPDAADSPALGPTRLLEECDAVDCFKIIEALKAWAFREAKKKGIQLNL